MPAFSSDDVLVSYANVLYSPVGTALPDETTVAWNADSGAYTSWTGWTLLGYTSAPTTFTYAYEVFEVSVEQVAAPIKRSKTNETLTISTSLAQFDADILALVLDGTATPTAAGASQKAYDKVVAGGDTELNEYQFAFEGYRVDDAGTKQPVRLFVYRATLTQNGDTAFDKGGVTSIPIQIQALGDSTKSAGQNLVEIHVVTGPTTTT
jgi:hypothetical protein